MVAMDFVGPLVESTQGNLHMLVITDPFSKFAEVIATPNQTAEVTANALWFGYCGKHGVPAILHSDQRLYSISVRTWVSTKPEHQVTILLGMEELSGTTRHWWKG